MKRTSLCLALLLGCALCLSACAPKDYPTDQNISQYITLGDYKGITYTMPPTGVTDAEVDQAIQQVLRDVATTQAVDREARIGDIVNIDFIGYIGGVAFEGGVDTNYNLTLGSNRFIAGFETQLVGSVTGQKVTIAVTFPDDYFDASFAGKPATFGVTVNRISEVIMPELDDAFVQSVSLCATVAEYKAYVREALAGQKASAAEEDMKAAVLTMAFDNAVVIKFPSGSLKEYTANMNLRYQGYAQENGMDFVSFLSSQMQMTVEEFNRQVEGAAKEWIRQDLVLRAVAVAEGINVSDDEYQRGLEKYVRENQYDSVESLLRDYTEDQIRQALRSEKVIDLILSSADIRN